MPPTFVQGNNIDAGNSGIAGAVAYTSNNTAGNLLVCLARFTNRGGTSYLVTDSQGNTWVPIYTNAYSGPIQQLVAAYALNCKGGPNTVTVTNAGGGTGFIRIAIGEWSGIPATATVEGPTILALTASSTTATTANLTTVGTQDLIIALGSQVTGNLSAPTVNNGFTVRVDGGTSIESDVTIADKVAAAGTYNATFTYSTLVNSGAGLIAFQAPIVVPPTLIAGDGPMISALFPVLMARMRIAAAYRNRNK
jgi:hypothetical protein